MLRVFILMVSLVGHIVLAGDDFSHFPKLKCDQAISSSLAPHTIYLSGYQTALGDILQPYAESFTFDNVNSTFDEEKLEAHTQSYNRIIGYLNFMKQPMGLQEELIAMYDEALEEKPDLTDFEKSFVRQYHEAILHLKQLSQNIDSIIGQLSNYHTLLHGYASAYIQHDGDEELMASDIGAERYAQMIAIDNDIPFYLLDQITQGKYDYERSPFIISAE